MRSAEADSAWREKAVCLTCDMMLLEDHERSSGPLCANCQTFYVDPEDPEQPCYHCFVTEGGLDPCRICAGNGAELLSELECGPELEEEAIRVRLVLSNRKRKIN